MSNLGHRHEFEDLTGRVFGKLTVLGFAGRNEGRRMWLVECSCPAKTHKEVREHALTDGATKSCRECPNNFYHRPDGVTVIEIVRRSGEIIPCFIDTIDYPLVQNHRWSALVTKGGIYATAYVRGSKPKKHTLMHRLICPDIEGEIDHRNHRPADNRRRNLRSATRQQNNAHARKKNSTGYRGVTRMPCGRFVSRITSGVGEQRRGRHIGTFDTAVGAARAYDHAAKKEFGRFALLNFPPKRPKDYVLEQRVRREFVAMGEL